MNYAPDSIKKSMAAFGLQQSLRLCPKKIYQVINSRTIVFGSNLISASTLIEISSIILSQLVRPFSLHTPLCGGAVPTIPVRKRDGISNRHWNPAFRKQRNWKVKIAHEGNQETNNILLWQVLKVDLPDYDWDRARARGDIPPEKVNHHVFIN